MKHIVGSPGILRSLVVASVLTLAGSVHAQDICWKDTYGRGVGAVPPPQFACGANEYDAGLCYPKCQAGYDGVGPVCWESCPAGFTNTGGHCLKPGAYGRGAGYPWKFGDALNDSGMKARCEADHGAGNCEKSGAIFYPKCKAGFNAVGCCVCSPACPSGMLDIGVSCQKRSYGRGVGTVPTECAPGWEYDAGLCYKPCTPGSDGVGPVCWGSCSGAYPVDCGAACGVSESACAGAIIRQVASTGQVALNLAALASGGGAVVVAGRTAAQAAGRSVMSAAARQAAKAALQQQLRSGLTKYAVTASSLSVLDRVSEGLLAAKENGEFDYAALDPTGIAFVVQSFDKPICGTADAAAAPAASVPPAPMLGAAVGGVRSGTPVATAASGGTCAGALQGRIAWDYAGNTSWARDNVNRLCRAVTSAEPARCFERVMHGGVDWGGGTRWEWGNAIDLCEGSTNASVTVSCFQRRIAERQPWQQAIAACDERATPPAAVVTPPSGVRIDAPAGSASCATAVQGRIAWDYAGSTTWSPENVNRLCSGAANAEPARCFDRAMHGGVNWGGGTRWEWRNAIDLCERSANADQTIGCFQQQVAQGRPWDQAVAACDERRR
jgi:hypothetical protein